jgi:uncharacterized protein (DUF1330 family)
MPKGYWIAHVSISDPDGYKAYVAANAEAFDKYGAEFLVRAGQNTIVEGEMRGDRHVVIAFLSYQAALDCYHSPEYAKAKAIRAEAAMSDIVIIEGYDGPQPGA